VKAHYIEKHIREKIHDWIASVEDESLREALLDGVIVAGGAITSLTLDEKVHDYDVYLRTKELCYRVAKYYVAKFKANPMNTVRFGYVERAVDIKVVIREDGRVMVMVKSASVAGEGGADDYQYFETIPDPAEREAAVEGFVTGVIKGGKEEDKNEEKSQLVIGKDGEKRLKYRPVLMTSNAITLSDDIQVVIRFYGEPKDIMANFDFQHTKMYWYSWGKKAKSRLHRNKPALECLLGKNRRLVYTGSRYPLCSLFRLRKFAGRGWVYDLGQVLKIVFQLHEMDLKNPRVLEEQLLGMDVAYFQEIIDRIRMEGIESVDTTYIASLVDELDW
jgi:hypothetical protein